MANLKDQYLYSQDASLQNKVKQQMVASAIAVSGEAQAFNSNRIRLATAILAPGGVTQFLSQFVAAVTNDATVSGKIAVGGASGTETDADIASAISAAWNAIANRQ
jgi:hypothetical protein